MPEQATGHFNPFDMGRQIGEARAMLRERGKQVCNSCPGRPTVSVAYVWTDGTTYLWIPAHKATHAVTGKQERVTAKAIPFHNEPDGRPHVELADCPRCRRVFVLMVSENSVSVMPAGHPTRAQVQD
jgi:hypothetical protein